MFSNTIYFLPVFIEYFKIFYQQSNNRHFPIRKERKLCLNQPVCSTYVLLPITLLGWDAMIQKVVIQEMWRRAKCIKRISYFQFFLSKPLSFGVSSVDSLSENRYHKTRIVTVIRSLLECDDYLWMLSETVIETKNTHSMLQVFHLFTISLTGLCSLMVGHRSASCNNDSGIQTSAKLLRILSIVYSSSYWILQTPSGMAEDVYLPKSFLISEMS